MFAQAFSLRFSSPRWDLRSLCVTAANHGGFCGSGSAGGAGKLDFSVPTFVRPGDQPEVPRLLLEFQFADLLGLDQMEYSCRGKHKA